MESGDFFMKTYEGIIDYMGLEDRGIITADDSENGTEALMEKCRALGKAM